MPYLALRYGTRADDRQIVGIRFGGIGDDWIELMERNFLPGKKLEDVCISLDREERFLLRQLMDIFDLERLVGSRSISILERGRTLHLEGASHPDLYRPSFHSTLFGGGSWRARATRT